MASNRFGNTLSPEQSRAESDLAWRDMDTTRGRALGSSRAQTRALWPRTLPPEPATRGHPSGGRQPAPVHGMMAGEGDDTDPERVRRREHEGKRGAIPRKGRMIE